MSEEVWAERDTTPAKIESALRKLETTRHDDDTPYVPARVMNLVVVADAEFRGEVENPLQRVVRYHPSRLVLCAVEHGRTSLDAWARIGVDDAASNGDLVVAHETVEITCGSRHLQGLDTIVDPLLVSDLATMVWAPHGHADA